VLLASITLAGHDAARAQTPSDLQAARETGLPGLRLVDVADVDRRVGWLGIRLGYVEQDVQPGHYFCGALAADRRVTAAEPVATALARLPYASIHQVGLRFVILCGGAKVGDRPIGGVSMGPLDLLMLDVSASVDDAFLEGTTLHELYHFAEFRFNTLRDADWNRQFTGYSNGYAAELLKGELGTGKPGFLNAYAETFPHEDRAELFAALVIKPDAVLEQIRATSDSVLRRKVLYMEEKTFRLFALRLALGRL
jgi:hypothetical protein